METICRRKEGRTQRQAGDKSPPNEEEDSPKKPTLQRQNTFTMPLSVQINEEPKKHVKSSEDINQESNDRQQDLEEEDSPGKFWSKLMIRKKCDSEPSKSQVDTRRNSTGNDSTDWEDRQDGQSMDEGQGRDMEEDGGAFKKRTREESTSPENKQKKKEEEGTRLKDTNRTHAKTNDNTRKNDKKVHTDRRRN
ncbi:hypothetical protein ABEB36_015835 [Hypothenemus hampei]|uniref:Uncharacterized protein n=1 Tax=Hypothenemus hampei TaxID=57062 RepID=A0ABD1DYX5_HYPHA